MGVSSGSDGPPVPGAPAIGVLLLENTHLRCAGAMANPASYAAGVAYETVRGASGASVIRAPGDALSDAYVAAARRAAGLGARIITANCGFTIAFQASVREATGRCVALSSLLLLPLLLRLHGDRVGVLTYDAAALGRDRLEEAGLAPGIVPPVADVQGSDEWRKLESEEPVALDLDRLRRDLTGIAAAFAESAGLRALLLECTGMFPFGADLRRALGLPVYDLYGLLGLALGAHRVEE